MYYSFYSELLWNNGSVILCDRIGLCIVVSSSFVMPVFVLLTGVNGLKDRPFSLNCQCRAIFDQPPRNIFNMYQTTVSISAHKNMQKHWCYCQNTNNISHEQIMINVPSLDWYVSEHRVKFVHEVMCQISVTLWTV